MKVIRIIARLNVGGPAKHVVWLTNRLQRRGIDSVLVAGTVPPGENDMNFFAVEQGVAPIFFTELSRELSPNDLLSLIKLYRLMRRERPDIVHTHTAKAGAVGRTAAFFYKWLTPGVVIGRPRPVIVVHTFHGHVLHSYYGRSKTGVFRTIERILARFATDRIIVISDQQLKEINGDFGIGRPEQFRVVPLGIELDGFLNAARNDSLRRDLGISSDTLLIGCIGRLTEIKDISLLLHGLREYSREPLARPLHVFIVGDGHLRARLEQTVKELEIGPLVTFLGNRSDVAHVVAALDIVALTSKNEGTPLSLIEAMAAGKTVVATPVGGVIDLLGDTIEEMERFDIRQRGIAITSRTPTAVADALIYSAQNEKLRERLSVDGRTFAESRYSLERLERDVVGVYDELMDEADAKDA